MTYLSQSQVEQGNNLLRHSPLWTHVSEPIYRFADKFPWVRGCIKSDRDFSLPLVKIFVYVTLRFLLHRFCHFPSIISQLRNALHRALSIDGSVTRHCGFGASTCRTTSKIRFASHSRHTASPNVTSRAALQSRSA